MNRLVLLQALPTFLATIQSVSSAAVSFRGLHPRDISQSNGTMWPSAVAGEFYDSSWANFAQATERWSTYEAPSFNEVFLPKTEQDIAIGVSILHIASRNFRAKRTRLTDFARHLATIPIKSQYVLAGQIGRSRVSYHPPFDSKRCFDQPGEF